MKNCRLLMVKSKSQKSKVKGQSKGEDQKSSFLCSDQMKKRNVLTLIFFSLFTAISIYMPIDYYWIFLSLLPSSALVMLVYLWLSLDELHPEYETTAMDDDGESDRTRDDVKKLEQTQLTWEEKKRTFIDVLPLISSMGIGYFLKYFLVQGIVTTISFEDAPFKPRDHFQVYMIAASVGECLGRSYLQIIRWICPSFLPSCRVRRLWILNVWQTSTVVLLALASLYHFLPNVYLASLLVVLSVFFEAMVFPNLGVLLSEKEHADFAVSLMEAFSSLLESAACVLAIFVERGLYRHCMHHYLNDPSKQTLCLTRRTNL